MPKSKSTKSETTSKIYACPTCGEQYATSTSCQRHAVGHLPQSQWPYKCRQDGCGKTFKQESSLKIHNFVHTRERPFKCKVGQCPAVFGDPSSASRHRREIHNFSVLFVCNIEGCKSHAKRCSTLRDHIKKKHNQLLSTKEIKECFVVYVERNEEPQDTSATDNVAPHPTPRFQPPTAPCTPPSRRVGGSLLLCPPELVGSSGISRGSPSSLGSPATLSRSVTSSPYFPPRVMVDDVHSRREFVSSSVSPQLGVTELHTGHPYQRQLPIGSQGGCKRDITWDSSLPFISVSPEVISPESYVSSLSSFSSPLGPDPGQGQYGGLYYGIQVPQLSGSPSSWLAP